TVNVSRDFVRLWAANTVSDFGSLVTRTALPFAAVLMLNATPFQMALLSAADLIAGLLVGLIAGVWVDRVRRRPLMIATDLGRAVLLLTIPVAATLGFLRMGQLYVVQFLAGAMTMVFVVAYQAYLPTLVRREELVRANSVLTASSAVSETVAFGSAGWLVQIFTAPMALLMDAFSFLFSAAALRTIRHVESVPAATAQHSKIWREIVDGARAVAGDRVQLATAVSLITVELGFQIIRPVYLLFTAKELGFSPGVLGMIFGLGGISNLAGSLLVVRAARRFGLGTAMIGGLVLGGVGMLLTPLARDTGWVSLTLLIGQQLIADGAVTAYDVSQVSLRQAITPPRILGRVNATIRFASHLLMLGAVLLGGVLWLALSPVRTMSEIPTSRESWRSPEDDPTQ
ncbi:MAG: MFS transporter, partial [bacterium]